MVTVFTDIYNLKEWEESRRTSKEKYTNDEKRQGGRF